MLMHNGRLVGSRSRRPLTLVLSVNTSMGVIVSKTILQEARLTSDRLLAKFKSAKFKGGRLYWSPFHQSAKKLSKIGGVKTI